MDQNERSPVLKALEALSAQARAELDAIANGFGAMASNLYWADNVALEQAGLVRIGPHKSFRFHNVEVTELGRQVVEHLAAERAA